MKGFVFFLPVMISIVFNLLLIKYMSLGLTKLSFFIFVWIILFFIGSLLLSKGIFWGGFVGALPAMYIIYMGTKETGQIINEMPLGIFFLVFYLFSSTLIFFKSNFARNND